MRPLLLLLLATLAGAVHAMSADDFLPPVRAQSDQERSTLLAVSAPVRSEPAGPLASKPDQQIVVAEKAQDAINHVVGRRRSGCEPIKFGSGFGWVATGLASYEEFANPTLTRQSRRSAYIQAFIRAKTNLTEGLNGLSSQAYDTLMERSEIRSTVDADLINNQQRRSAALSQAVSGLIQGFVTYDVHDNTKTREVSVSIVTTPRTRGAGNRIGGEALEATDIRDGLQRALDDIQAGLIPPVGGKIVLVASTGETAFVGFGSAIIAISDDAGVQGRLRLQAERLAGARAKDGLVGILLGDRNSYRMNANDQEIAAIQMFEQGMNEQTNEVETRRIAGARSSLQRHEQMNEVWTSARKGELPPGVSTRSFVSKDGGEVYAISVYVPSVRAIAERARDDMANSTPMGEPPAVTGDGQNPEQGQGNVPPPADPNRPGTVVAPGPSGQVTQDGDL